MTYAELKRVVKPTLYKVVNLITNEFYIGSAWRPIQRYHDHWKCLRLNAHSNRRLQAAYNQYGVASFQWETVRSWSADELDRSTLYRLEQQYIDTLRPSYNIQLKVNGFIMTDEIRSILSRKNRKLWTVTRPDGTEVEVDNLNQFCFANDLSRSAMGNVVAGLSRTHKGWLIRPRGVVEARRTSRMGHLYEFTSPAGVVTTARNLAAFARQHGLTSVGLGHVARGYQRHHHGWTCKKIEGSII